MDQNQYFQLITAITAQNALLAKLLIRIDTGKMPIDDEAFKLAMALQTQAVNALVTGKTP